MENCQLGSLRQIMHVIGRAFREEEIAIFVRNTLLGLSLVSSASHSYSKGLLYLHWNKKIHRDVKAENILVTDIGEAKLGNHYPFLLPGYLKSFPS